MEKVRCKNGHYYDPEWHTNCPYCGIDIEDFIIHKGSQSANYGHSFEEESYGKTMPIQDYLPNQKKNNVGPVAGWLVVLNGSNKGKDYHILIGRNKIGRLTMNEIALEQDEAVELLEHGNIIYDTVSNSFTITPGSATALIYVNDQILLGERILKEKDHIRVGRTELLFVPLCSEEFRW
ncbi:MAG: hypothetical protein K0S47_2320 [Herbinix sp.]|jgi:hypothetical protein|nr:hypothetical protein [Herbinix sp.]